MTVIEGLRDGPDPDHVRRARKETLHLRAEAVVGARLRDDAEDRHVVGEQVGEIRLGSLHAPQIFGDTHPRHVNVLARIGVAAPVGDERLQRPERTGEVAELEPPRIEDREGNAFFFDGAGVRRHGAPLPRRGELTLEHAVHERALAHAGAARHEDVRVASLAQRVFERLLDRLRDVELLHRGRGYRENAYSGG